MELVLLSSITGQEIKKCMDRLAEYATQSPRSRRLLHIDTKGRLFDSESQRIDTPKDCDIVWACLEDALPAAATEKLRRLFPAKNIYGLHDVLTLPYQELAEACRTALEVTVEWIQKTKVRRSLLALHPVLFHQQTKEFVPPYNPTEIRNILEAHGIEPRWVVSLHDDIFDIHRRLLLEHRLFGAHAVRTNRGCPKERRSFLDIEQQRLLLEWRAAELAESRKISGRIQARHHLLHQKCRLGTFWAIAMEDIGSVYLSHPISQPRRDITGVRHPKKCLQPDKERGKRLIDDCNSLADALAAFVPLVEPTNIDELRLATRPPADVLKSVKESALASAIMPPLTPRWPVTKKPRLGELPTDEELETTFLPVALTVFQGLSPKGDLKAHKGALELLEAEISRQINVRDITLAEQADLIVVYRPFTEPDSPEASGGVTGEIETAARKAKLRENTCKPPVLMIHPMADENRRRKVYFEQNWDAFARIHCGNIADAEFAELRAAIWRILEKAPYHPDVEATKEKIEQFLDSRNIAVTGKISQERAAIGGDSYSISRSGRTQFVYELVEKYAFLKPDILRDFGDLIRVENIMDSGEIASLVRNSLEDFRRSVQTTKSYRDEKLPS